MTILKSLWLLLILLIVGISARATAESSPITPIDAGKPGASAAQTIHATKEHLWVVSLVLIFPKGDMETYQRIYEVAESISGGAHIPPRPHAGIRFSVSCTEKRFGKDIQIVRRIVTTNGLDERAPDGVGVVLDSFRLPPGDYVVSIEEVDGDKRLEGIQARLFVGHNPLSY